MSASRAPTLVGLAALALLATGCKDIPEVAYETEHFEIAPDFDHPICAGTLAHFEDHLDFVESALARSVPFGERIRFYWITQDLDSWCNDRAIGCYYPGSRVIIGNGASATHEIVHAVLNAEAQTNLFLEEALAEHFSGVGAYHRPQFSSRPSPAELLWISPKDYRFGELDYAVAQHFMAFLYSTQGIGSIRGITDVVVTGAGPPELERAVERFTELSLEELEEAYVAHAPSYYRGLGESEVPAVESRIWADLSLRCDEDTTFGPLWDAEPGMYRSVRLELDEPRAVDVTFVSDEDVRATFVDVRKERKFGRVVDFFHPELTGKVEHPVLQGDESRTLQLDRGTHLIVVSRQGYDYADAFLQVELREFPRDPSTPP